MASPIPTIIFLTISRVCDLTPGRPTTSAARDLSPPPPSGRGGCCSAPLPVACPGCLIPAPRMSCTFTLRIGDLGSDPGGPEGESAALFDPMLRRFTLRPPPRRPGEFPRSDELPPGGGPQCTFVRPLVSSIRPKA